MKLKIEPTSKVQVWYDDHRLTKITKLNEELVPPPPFTALYFQVHTISFYYSGTYVPDEPIKSIKAQYQNEPQISFEGTEDIILREFCNFVLIHDPDIVISTEQHYRSTGIMQYLLARMNELGIDVALGRSDSNNNIEGRIYIDDNSHLVEIIEKARFSFLPLGLAARYSISRLIDSRNCYELFSRGFVFPSTNNRQEPIRTVEEIFAKDKGGMIFSPQVGLHENVIVLDYENEYANLIPMKGRPKMVKACSRM
jgi:DNA polymerase elongation subunit (family B)